LVGSLERHGMSAVLESTPTATMRQELAAADVEIPGDEQLTALSRIFNEWIEDLRHNKGMAASHSWYNLFKEMDEDGSGFLTYDELSDVVRHKLKKGQKAFPEDALKALWCAIDVDDSNSVMQDEMASFFRRGAPEKKKLVKGPKEHSSASLVGSLERHGMGRALESAPTDKMREELVSAGVELPGEEELKLYAKSMNEWLEKARYEKGLSKSTSFFNLFKEVDEDGSGFLTFDEFRKVVREKLHVRKSVLLEDELKAIWCALDADDSNQVQIDEFTRFLRGQQSRANLPKLQAKQAAARRATAAAAAREIEDEIRWKQEKDEAVESRQAAIREYRRELRQRTSKDRLQQARASAAKQRSVEAARHHAEYKRRMLREMQEAILRSPIPLDTTGTTRLGAQRILPLYQSERLIAFMEGSQPGTPKCWPSRQWMPRPPSTPLTGELSRAEALLMPSLSSRTLSPTLTNRFRRANTPSLDKWPVGSIRPGTSTSFGSATRHRDGPWGVAASAPVSPGEDLPAGFVRPPLSAGDMKRRSMGSRTQSLPSLERQKSP